MEIVFKKKTECNALAQRSRSQIEQNSSGLPSSSFFIPLVFPYGS